MTITHIRIIRHGETDANRQEIVQGQLDTHLNAAGLRQAESVALSSKDATFDAAYTSDLSRSAKTAEIIMAYHPGVPLQRHAALRERHLGTLQGKTYSQKRAAVNINDDKTAESGADFLQRALNWWDEFMVETTRAQARSVLVVSHGGFISTLVHGILQHREVTSELASGNKLWKCWNCSVTTIELDLESGKARLLGYGDITHLDGRFKMVESNVDVQAEKDADANKKAGRV